AGAGRAGWRDREPSRVFRPRMAFHADGRDGRAAGRDDPAAYAQHGGGVEPGTVYISGSAAVPVALGAGPRAGAALGDAGAGRDRGAGTGPTGAGRGRAREMA